MAKVGLFHFDPTEGSRCAERLAAAGHTVDYRPRLDPAILQALRDSPPDALVIDLSRSPSQGRDLGLWLRTTAATRRVPLLFVGGAIDKVAKVRELLPDATYTTWEATAAELGRALASPPRDPVVPSSVFAGYSGTPLPRKLGIKDGSRVALLHAPEGLRDTLGELPESVTFTDRLGPAVDLAMWFVRSLTELEAGIADLAAGLGGAHVWIAWPKKGSALAADVTQQAVRDAGLANGLVDYKVCAIDATWSGLKFVRRKA